MIPLTTEEKIHYNEQEICYICKKEFDKSDKKHYKVRDHCHYTGKYRSAEITYKIKFIDSYRFMSMPLSKLIDNSSEEIHNNKCADCKSCLDYVLKM